MNQQQSGRRNSGHNRRKNTRNANKKKQQTTNTHANNHVKEEEEQHDEQQQQQTTLSKPTTENEEESTVEHSDAENEQIQDNPRTEQPSPHVEDKQESTVSPKQRNRNKNTNESSSQKQETIVPPKPQASVAPVKQNPSSPFKDPKFPQHKIDDYPKTNGHSSPSYNNGHTYSAYNPLPPRFQQQRQQQREATFGSHRHRRRRGRLPPQRSSIPPGSAGRQNEFVPSSIRHQQQEEQEQEQEQEQDEQQIDYNQTESHQCFMQQPQQEPLMHNGYFSESDILTDSPSTGGNNSASPLLSTSADSQSSLQRLDLVRSLSAPSSLLDELLAVFDRTSFSSDELEVILNKIATRHISDKHDLQRFIPSSTKSDKSFERIIDETYRSQAKILAIELQAEKSRVLELTKSNADMENTIRQFQQQQPNNMVQYQQMILPYQMQLRRLADENARLQQQLHAYSMLPASINELKQQQHVVNEQIRQMTIRNSALENEVADSERASKHAAEIYKKADAQKQERIEQMIADINKYRKLDKELTTLRQKHNELEKELNSKITHVSQQRDDLQANCDKLKEKIEQYEKLPMKSSNELEQELNDLKTKNDQLRQSNWKTMEELNKVLQEQNSKSS